MSNAKKVEWFDGRDELDEELKKHGFISIVAEEDGAFWATVAHDGPNAVIVISASGGERGKTSPYAALAEAVEKAIARKDELR